MIAPRNTVRLAALFKQALAILRKSEQVGAPALLHYDMDLVLRTVRDLFTADTQRLLVDDARDHQRILDFVDTVMPRLENPLMRCREEPNEV